MKVYIQEGARFHEVSREHTEGIAVMTVDADDKPEILALYGRLNAPALAIHIRTIARQLPKCAAFFREALATLPPEELSAEERTEFLCLLARNTQTTKKISMEGG